MNIAEMKDALQGMPIDLIKGEIGRRNKLKYAQDRIDRIKAKKDKYDLLLTALQKVISTDGEYVLHAEHEQEINECLSF